jgi:hypothetical protein
MDREQIVAAIERVKNSERNGLPARLAPELSLLESAVAKRLITWTEVAKRLGASKSYLTRARSNSKRLYASLNDEAEPSTVPPAQTQQPVPPAQTQQPVPVANPNERSLTSDEKFARMKARFREKEKAEAEARENAKSEEPELDEESRGLLDMFENSGNDK